MDQVNESSGGTPSIARQKSVWGRLLQPNPDKINQDDHSNANEDDQSDRDDPEDQDDNESVAFNTVFEPAQILWLQSFDLTNEQLKAIEGHPQLGMNAALSMISLAVGHPQLGMNAALSMISLAVANAEDLDKVKALENENRALRSFIKRESGWSESYIKDKINEPLSMMSSLVEIPLGPLPEGESAIIMNSGHRTNRAALVTLSEEKALRINDVTPENMQQFADHLRRALARGVDDNRLGVLSTDAIAQIHCTLQAKLGERVPLDSTATLWMSQQTAVLASLIEQAFPKVGADTAQDWAELFMAKFVELDVKSEVTFRQYMTDVLNIANNAQCKTSAQSDCIKALLQALTKPPKCKQGAKVTKCNRAMQKTLQQRVTAGDITTVHQYCVHFQQIAHWAKTGLEKYAPWDNSQNGPAEKLGKRGGDAENPAIPNPKRNKSAHATGNNLTPSSRLCCAGCNNQLAMNVTTATNE